MNVTKEIFEDKWEKIRAQSKVWWSLFTDDDLKKVEKAPIKRDKYAMMLRVKYGYSHERAREEINKRITALEAGSQSSELTGNPLDHQDSSMVSKDLKRRIKKPARGIQ